MDSKNNLQIVREIMTYSEHGALIQAFVIEALSSYSEMILNANMPEDGIVSPEAWKGCAKEVLEKLDNFYGRKNDAINQE